MIKIEPLFSMNAEIIDLSISNLEKELSNHRKYCVINQLIFDQYIEKFKYIRPVRALVVYIRYYSLVLLVEIENNSTHSF